MPRILIVEDEAANVEILTRLLKRKQFDFLVAGNMLDAIRLAAAEQPDLILMDIGIPDSDGAARNDAGGLEATQAIKANEGTKSIPIIALTAHAMLDDKKRFVEAGCDGVQTKPYAFADLLAAIDELISK